ncbi:MAG: hypothetical protein IJA55_04145 [Clostridia bacterium]|nr:hypothetical protein [Clostridia bacterium]
MASIIIHMAVTVNALDICGIETDRDEYLVGTILPDYVTEENAHYKDLMGERKFFNLARFRKEHADKLTDPIYKGYYLHLVQDMIFRDFMYNTHGFSPAERKNVLKLYADYQRLNGYLARRYSIPIEILKNMDVVASERYSDFTLNKPELAEETEKYHNINICPEGEYSFFTPEMAEEYVRLASDACIREMLALRGEKEHINEFDYSWIRFFNS